MILNAQVNSGHHEYIPANTSPFCLAGKSNVVAKAAVSRWTGELVGVVPQSNAGFRFAHGDVACVLMQLKTS